MKWLLYIGGGLLAWLWWKNRNASAATANGATPAGLVVAASGSGSGSSLKSATVVGVMSSGPSRSSDSAGGSSLPFLAAAAPATKLAAPAATPVASTPSRAPSYDAPQVTGFGETPAPAAVQQSGAPTVASSPRGFSSAPTVPVIQAGGLLMPAESPVPSVPVVQSSTRRTVAVPVSAPTSSKLGGSSSTSTSAGDRRRR